MTLHPVITTCGQADPALQRADSCLLLTAMDRDETPPAAYPRPSEIVELVTAMPHLADAIDDFEKECRDDPEAPGLYLCVDVIWDWLNPLLENGSEIDPAFFVWLEDLATSPEQATRTFLKVGLLEVMGDNPRSLERLRAQMGPATVMASVEIEAFWGRPEPEHRH